MAERLWREYLSLMELHMKNRTYFLKIEHRFI